jgi:hypothetical protein
LRHFYRDLGDLYSCLIKMLAAGILLVPAKNIKKQTGATSLPKNRKGSPTGNQKNRSKKISRKKKIQHAFPTLNVASSHVVTARLLRHSYLAVNTFDTHHDSNRRTFFLEEAVSGTVASYLESLRPLAGFLTFLAAAFLAAAFLAAGFAALLAFALAARLRREGGSDSPGSASAGTVPTGTSAATAGVTAAVPAGGTAGGPFAGAGQPGKAGRALAAPPIIAASMSATPATGGTAARAAPN